MKKIKIGILKDDLDKFYNWELKIFEKISQDKRFEISAFILDGRRPESNWVKIRRNIKGKRFVSTFLYSVANALERKLFLYKYSYDSPEFHSRLDSIKTIEVFPRRKGYVDFFSLEDSETVSNLELDIILRHGFNIIKGPIINSAKYGIWSFHHADNRLFRGSPAGFWEVYYGTPVTGVTLQILNEELDGGAVIGRGFYNTKWNATINNQSILENSVSLIWKSLEYLYKNDRIDAEEPYVYSGRLFRAPTVAELLYYTLRVTKAATRRVAERIWGKLGFRPNMWSLCFGRGRFEDATLWRTKEVLPDRGEYWADPFLHRRDGKLYVFYENYVYAEKKGKISVGTWNGKSFSVLGDALDLENHLSFPFIFEDQGETYMIPECYMSGAVSVWRCKDFPLEWEPVATALKDHSVVDTVLFKRNGEWWMFANLSVGPVVDHCIELHAFKVDGPMLRSVIPHRQNPIVIDSKVARNGGRIFEEDGKLYRPSQNNSHGIYGYGLNLMEITELTLDAYSERLVQRVFPRFKSGQIGCHHLDVSEDVFVVDICRRFAR